MGAARRTCSLSAASRLAPTSASSAIWQHCPAAALFTTLRMSFTPSNAREQWRAASVSANSCALSA